MKKIILLLLMTMLFMAGVDAQQNNKKVKAAETKLDETILSVT